LGLEKADDYYDNDETAVAADDGYINLRHMIEAKRDRWRRPVFS
jgi:hypothetical protein